MPGWLTGGLQVLQSAVSCVLMRLLRRCTQSADNQSMDFDIDYYYY